MSAHEEVTVPAAASGRVSGTSHRSRSPEPSKRTPKKRKAKGHNLEPERKGQHQPREGPAGATRTTGLKTKYRDNLNPNERPWHASSAGEEAPPTSTQKMKCICCSFTKSREMFNNRYQQQEQLGKGGVSTVYAGFRRWDNLPVAIKHIPKKKSKSTELTIRGQPHDVPLEVLLMLRAGGVESALGINTVVSLLHWYDLGDEVVIVMERPVPSMELLDYVNERVDPLTEDEAKNIMWQLVDAAVKFQNVNIFHRDLKLENILIEASSDVPRVRIIDFGRGCVDTGGLFHSYSGTLLCAPPEFHSCGRYRAGPTTVWQLGLVMFQLFHTDVARFIPELLQEVVRSSPQSDDCKNFLLMCLNEEPTDRATLKQMKEHRWLE